MKMENGTPKLKMLQSNLGAKIAALMLLLVFIITTAASLLGVAILFEDGAYSANTATDFYDSTLCGMVAEYHFQQLKENLRYMGIGDSELLSDPDWAYYGDNTNVLFRAQFYKADDDGNIAQVPYKVLQNCDGEGISAEYEFSTYAYPSEYENGYFDSMNVTLYIRAPLMDNGEGFTEAYFWFNFIHSHEVDVVLWFIASLLLFFAMLIFLLWGAGHKKGLEGIHLNWFHRIPLDFLTAVLGVAVVLLIAVAMMGFDFYNSYFWLQVAMMGLSALTALILIVLFLVTLSARIKGKKWWRNTLIYLWLWRGLCCICRRLKNGMVRFFRMLPLAWRALLGFAALSIIGLMMYYNAFWNSSGFWLFMLLIFHLALAVGVVFFAGQMRILEKGGQELARGNLEYKTRTEKMYWDFRRHGENLNRISEGMEKAVVERMKSEKFKTELITNVSHDIKTPLTSIINYVDLLKREDMSNDKTAEYIEVLDRQSARLKKLTEDLVEASKVSAGVVKAEKMPGDIRELLLQALGEYRERLENAGIDIVMGDPGQPLSVICDGRLMWRVFDNILSNICKYAQPGTRAFIDLETSGGYVKITFKNTSRDMLNITAEELMERFVRGDRARNTEGSGLGLSIARSLVELQGGSFELSLDGDLFKAIATMPAG